MKTGLFFGSFNPIHTGHLVIANQFVEFSDIEVIWFVVSPKNPLKDRETLMEADLRLKMVNAAIADNNNFKVCDVEFYLPPPSYTIHTLDHLSQKHPENEFIIIMGSDSYHHLPKWKDHEKIKSNFPIYIYKRQSFEIDHTPIGKGRIFDFPYLNISATYIRECLQQKKSVRYLVPDKILSFLT